MQLSSYGGMRKAGLSMREAQEAIAECDSSYWRTQQTSQMHPHLDSHTVHANHVFYNIETFEIVYRESRPAYMKEKTR